LTLKDFRVDLWLMPTHYHGTDAETLALDVFIKLVRAAGSVAARTSAAFSSEGLTAGQFGVLEAILHLGPLYQCDLARKHLLSGGNVTMIVDNLEKHGLVRRERSVDDRRYIQVHLTAKGRKMIQRIFPGHVRAVTEQMAVLRPAEQEELGRLCRKLGLGANAEAEACR
jgi:MarR family 2-MHQ and catechol resistance regulon transcriptional repressor